MKAENMCMGCLEDTGGKAVCPLCGYSEKTVSDFTYIAPRTVLKGRYVIGRTLGRGGFGITYIAWDKLNECKTAIKEYFPEGTVARMAGRADVSVYLDGKGELFKEGLEKFLAEARSIKRYQEHPGIVNVYDFFHENGTGYIVMEYLDGQTLTAYLSKHGGKVALPIALQLLENIFYALETMHKDDMLHRDIKPDNIFIRSNAQSVLIDFGVARQFIEVRSRLLSSVFTPGYAPFEQYCNDSRQGPWTDVYALGATLYRALTGERPPEATDRIVHDRLAPLQAKGVQVSPAIEAAMNKALAINRQERFQSIAEFRAALATELDSATLSANIDISAYVTKNADKVICPYCKVANILTAGQTVHNTLCRECGNILAKRPRRNYRKVKYWTGIALAVLVLAAGGYWLAASGAIGRMTATGERKNSEIPAATTANTAKNTNSAPDKNAAAPQPPAMTPRPPDADKTPPVQPVAPAKAAAATPESPPPRSAPPRTTYVNWETDVRGIKLTNSGVRAGEVFMWSGRNSGGYADGAGTVSYFKDGVLQRKMTGTWDNGKLIPGTAAMITR